MSFSQIPALSLRDQVVEQIRQAIIEGRLRPNDHIVENLLTEQMGVSRTPVREALILLEREGLVVAYPNRGFYVRQFTPSDVRHIFSMRAQLENFAAELNIDSLCDEDFQHLEAMIEKQQRGILADDFKTVRSIDMQFHRYIVAHNRHPLLLRSWTELVAQIAALLYLRAESVQYNELMAIRDHNLIVEAYRSRDLSRVFAINREINERVSAECVQAIERLAKP